MKRVSGCVISLNEEDRIERCLASLSFCDELLVLDSGSTDRTCEIARRCGARVEHQDFLGHRDQKQRAVDLASHDWVLSLDCDEHLSEDLVREIEGLRKRRLPDNVRAFSMPRRNVYLGRAMRHGLFWPDRKLRFFDRRHARWGGTNPHDRVEADADVMVVSLEHCIGHDSYRSFDDHRRTVLRFADIAAEALEDEGRRAGPMTPLLRSAAAFFKGSVLKLGVLDGWRGVVAAWMSARYNYRKYSRLRGLRSGRIERRPS